MSLVGGSAALPALCATTVLPINAIIQLGEGLAPLTLTEEAVLQMPCPTIAPRSLPDTTTASDESSLTSSDAQQHQVSDFRDPFYATQFPMCYALATTTVTAYMLVIMLFVTPRSFLNGGIVYLGRRGGFTHNGSSGGVNIGRRPWLQKIATLTVAISLTIATAHTFVVAKEQYKWGIQNARLMQLQVMGSTGLKIIRIISDTFLWLAQAQTLIRLFPRQREKTIIKWVAFALITLDVIFTALNSFQYSDDGVTGSSRPNSFIHPVPALSYLFQLSLGILYAAWVIYYALMKKRYAFYHPLMKNICLVAIMAVTAVVIPVVFFIIDISRPNFTGWGDYVRWVGAAAASVIVWEWVERIEALEREEKKDGVLGREVFDGDDTMEFNAAEEFSWLRHIKNRRGGRPSGDDGGVLGHEETVARPVAGPPGFATGSGWPSMAAIASRYRGQGAQQGQEGYPLQVIGGIGGMLHPQSWPTRPAPIATPVSRTDTPSTVYAVRYQPASEATTRTPEPLAPQQSMVDLSRQNSTPLSNHTGEEPAVPIYVTSNAFTPNAPHMPPSVSRRSVDSEGNAGAANSTSLRMANRGTISDHGQGPAAAATAAVDDAASTEGQSQTQQSPAPASEGLSSPGARDAGRRWDLRARLEEFAANQAEKLRERMRPTTDTADLPVTIIPAPPRRGTALQQVLEEEETNGNGGGPSNQESNGSASADMSQLGRRQSVVSNTSRGQESIPSNNPPLWPGVRPRSLYEDDGYLYDDSTSDASSVDPHRRDSADGPSTAPAATSTSARAAS